MTRFLTVVRPNVVALTALAVGGVAAVALNWPGHLSYDSLLQLQQGRSGVYNSWHPPVMAWLLGLGDTIAPGTGLFILCDALLAFGALAGVLMLGRARGAAVAVCVAAVAMPQLLIFQADVWKDVLFADSAVAGFVALAWTGRARGRWRWATAGGSFVLLTLAALTRQNGVVILPFAAAAAGWIATREGLSRGRAALFGGGVLVALGVAVLACGALLASRVQGESGPAEQFRLLQVYDLAGAVADDPNLALTALDDDEPEMAEALRRHARTLYTPVRNDPLISAPQMQGPLAELDEDALRADWNGLVLTRTWLYLRVRARVFGWLLFTPDIAACRPIFTGVEGPPDVLRGLGMENRRDGRDVALEAYGRAFFGTPVLSHVPFLLIAIGAMAWLLRRRRAEDIAVAAMLGASLSFTASFFFISIACDYRYLFLLDLSALAALLYLCVEHTSAP